MKNVSIKDEAEIASVAKVFLELNNWSTYPEVVINLFNGRPDYVCVKNDTLCQVVECKKTLSYPVIEQLARWQIDAEKRKEWNQQQEERNKHVSGYSGKQNEIAIPHLLTAFVSRTNGQLSDLKKAILTQYRIGVFSISKRFNRRWDKSDTPYICSYSGDYWTLVWGDSEYTIHQEVAPKIQHGSRKTAHKIINELNNDMRCAQAGVKGGETEYMTPFKRTMNRVKEVLSDGKERHIDHILDEIKPLGGHHYATDKVAKSSISKFIDTFEIAQRARNYGPWFVIGDINK